MERASRRIGGLAGLFVIGAGLCWWSLMPVSPSSPDNVAIVHAPTTERMAEPVIVATAPTPVAVPRAVDPVVAERRDVAVLAAVAEKRSPDDLVLDGAMQRQARDPVRAEPTEAAMRAALLRVPALAGGKEPPHVLCVGTTCEVTGVASDGRSPAEIEQALRDPTMLHAMVARGYMPGPATVAATGSGGVGYVLYLNNEM